MIMDLLPNEKNKNEDRSQALRLRPPTTQNKATLLHMPLHKEMYGLVFLFLHLSFT